MVENKNEFETVDFENIEENKTNNISNQDLSKSIFSDFNADSSLEADLQKIKEKENKDIFYYINIIWFVLKIIFISLILVLSLWYTYIYIQNSEEFSEKEYLTPICWILNWNIVENSSGCSSISYLDTVVKNDLENLYKNQTSLILSVLPIIYERESFLKNKEIFFLLDKSKNKLKVLDILSKFDFYKNDFTGIEKKKLECNNFTIDAEEKILSLKCNAYSRWYTSEIIWFSAEKNSKEMVSWTSISIANSFINYLEKNAFKYFIVLDRQKTFWVESVLWNWAYTKKTSFDLKLKINF